MRITTLFIIAAWLSACNAQEKKSNGDTGEKTPENAAVTTCYAYTSDADTITLQLTSVSDTVTGSLVYKLKEKDSNTGTIRGIMKDSILLADYSFLSEGVNSVRQVAFKQEGDHLVEGYGDVVDNNGKTSFKNKDSLTFSSTLKIHKKNCD